MGSGAGLRVARAVVGNPHAAAAFALGARGMHPRSKMFLTETSAAVRAVVSSMSPIEVDEAHLGTILRVLDHAQAGPSGLSKKG